MDVAMELLKGFEHSSILLPTWDVMILLVVITLCLLFRWNRAGLIIAYVDAYRWGWVFFNESFKGLFQTYLIGYYIFGVVVVLLYLLSWYFSDHTQD
jgi:hypothetical protein